MGPSAKAASPWLTLLAADIVKAILEGRQQTDFK
jgi:hypothetical protein